ncbi:MAG: B12-binding domain-containing radical SAM protein [Candidatus Bathyarchaeota archaeon]|nr:B12-binding domain-containing radical SAM protein [Candidatus Bathyarchaeota archaeon]
MKILLVNPPRFKGIPVIREERCEVTDRYSVLPPYSLLQIASLLKSNSHEVSLIDANGLNLSWDQIKKGIVCSNYDALIFRFTPTTFGEDIKVAAISKTSHRNAWTIGICWTLQTLPESVLQTASELDIYIRHEYETVTPSLVSALSQGNDLSSVRGIAYRDGSKINVNDPAEPLSNWANMPLPDYDLLPSLKNYYINTHHGSPFTIMYAGKGCPFSCIYCTERHTKLKNRSAASIIEELRFLKQKYNVKTLSFFDETFTIDKERTITIANAIKKEKMNIVWYCNTRVNLVDESLLKIMYAGGCRGISFGIESGSQKILDNAEKGITVQQAEYAIRLVKKVGIKVYCSFIFGLPGENWDTVKETIKFVKRTLPTGAQFNVAVPYPGTELQRIATEKGWIGKDISWHELYQHESVMRTDELTSFDLDKARKMAYQALYFNNRWWMNNIWYTFRHIEDLPLAARYAIKIVNNYIFHKMEHAH